MKKCLLLLSLFLFLFAPGAHAIDYSCPLHKQDITGVMQWNDGFPFNAYDRHSHCGSGSCNSWAPVDVNAYYGSQVKSPVSGQIVSFFYGSDGFLPGNAYRIGIRGDDGLYYKLVHLKEAYITSETKTVVAGQRLGRLITRQQTASAQRECDRQQTHTSEDCIKVHLHFEVYSGTGFDKPTENGGRTPEFLLNHCGIGRPADKAEFPNLPTLNCAKVAGNPHINRCFMQNPLDLTGDDAVTIDDYRLVISNYGSYSLSMLNRLISRLY